MLVEEMGGTAACEDVGEDWVGEGEGRVVKGAWGSGVGVETVREGTATGAKDEDVD